MKESGGKKKSPRRLTDVFVNPEAHVVFAGKTKHEQKVPIQSEFHRKKPCTFCRTVRYTLLIIAIIAAAYFFLTRPTETDIPQESSRFDAMDDMPTNETVPEYFNREVTSTRDITQFADE